MKRFNAFVLVLYLLLFVSIRLSAVEPPFDSPLKYLIGDDPGTFCTADFNSDGDPDFALISGGLVYLLINDGALSFQAPVVYSEGSGPAGICSGDIDDDGDWDIGVLYNLSNELVFLENQGDGTFTRGSSTTINAAWHVCASDFNGDGHCDFAVQTSGTPDSIVVMRMSEDGYIVQKTSYAVDDASTVRTADLDGDDRGDLIVDTGDATILINNGDGTFQSPVTYGIAPDCLADFDGDEDVDIAEIAGDAVLIAVNGGDGTFTHPVAAAGEGGDRTVEQAPDDFDAANSAMVSCTADLDGDGDEDIVQMTGDLNTDDIRIFMNNGDGSFPGPTIYNAGAYWCGRAIVAVDLDGDGYPELVRTHHLPDEFLVIPNSGDGTFRSLISHYVGIGYLMGGMCAADFDNDGLTDAAFCKSVDPGYKTVCVAINNGDMTFKTPVQYSMTINPPLITADFDNDGYNDIASVGDFAVMLNNGDGTFQVDESYSTWGYCGCAGDLDGDGDIDLALGENGIISLVLNDGNGSFLATTFPVTSGTPRSLCAADVDGDLDLDLVAITISADYHFCTFLNDGAGSFTEDIAVPADGIYNAMAVGDLDGDADVDIVGTCSWKSSLSVWLNDGDGSFQGPAELDVGDTQSSIVLCDLDDDGNCDIVAGCTVSYAAVLMNLGGGSFEPAVAFDMAEELMDVEFGDFDGDGRMDIAGGARMWNGKTYISLLINTGDGGHPFRYVSHTGGNLYPYSQPAWAALSIGGALDAAEPGDTVLVAAGTYDETLEIHSDLYFMGGWYPYFTERDCASHVSIIADPGAGSAVSFLSVPSGSPGIDGFMLLGGDGTYLYDPRDGFYGGGVYSYESPAVIKNNILTGCGRIGASFFSGGGGIYCRGGSVTISGNTIEACTAQSGGGVYLRGATAELSGNEISGSLCHGEYTGSKEGGGIYAVQSTVTMAGNSIHSNEGYNKGGGLYLSFSTLASSGDSLCSNSCTIDGGGSCSERSTVSFMHAVALDNHAAGVGGGIYHRAGRLEIGNSLVAMNDASIGGGGVYADSTWGELANNTLDRNTAAYFAGNVYMRAVEPMDTKNNMITYGSPTGFLAAMPDDITFRFNNSYGNTSGDVSGLVPDSTNVSADPCYADSMNLDYHLGLHSCGIDAGDPSDSDPDGSPADIGAFGGPLASFAAPPAVTGLAASAVDDTTISLSWDGMPGQGLDFFAVYGDTASGFRPDLTSFLGTVPAGSSAFVHAPVSGCWYYRLNVVDARGYAGGYSGTAGACAEGGTTGTGEMPPFENRLGQNYPNPFNGSTTIRFSLGAMRHVTLRIYDPSGRLVRTLVDDGIEAGDYKVLWNGRNDGSQPVASGVYFVRIVAGGFVESRKIVFLR